MIDIEKLKDVLSGYSDKKEDWDRDPDAEDFIIHQAARLYLESQSKLCDCVIGNWPNEAMHRDISKTVKCPKCGPRFREVVQSKPADAPDTDVGSIQQGIDNKGIDTTENKPADGVEGDALESCKRMYSIASGDEFDDHLFGCMRHNITIIRHALQSTAKLRVQVQGLRAQLRLTTDVLYNHYFEIQLYGASEVSDTTDINNELLASLGE